MLHGGVYVYLGVGECRDEEGGGEPLLDIFHVAISKRHQEHFTLGMPLVWAEQEQDFNNTFFGTSQSTHFAPPPPPPGFGVPAPSSGYLFLLPVLYHPTSLLRKSHPVKVKKRDRTYDRLSSQESNCTCEAVRRGKILAMNLLFRRKRRLARVLHGINRRGPKKTDMGQESYAFTRFIFFALEY